MIGPTSRGGSRHDIKKIQVAAMTTHSATPDRSQYVPRRRAATRSSRPTMGRNLMENVMRDAWCVNLEREAVSFHVSRCFGIEDAAFHGLAAMTGGVDTDGGTGRGTVK